MNLSLHGPDIPVKEFSSLAGKHIVQALAPSTEVVVVLSETQEEFETLLPKISSQCLVLHSALTHTATEIGTWSKMPENIIGIGFAAGFSRNTTIELCSGRTTGSAAMKRAEEFIVTLEKKPVIVPDVVGLVAPRTIAMLVNEASFALAENVASVQDIDNAMKLGTNYPRGPLAWADEIGLNDIVAILDALHLELGDDRYRVSPLLRAKARAKEKFYQ